MSRKKDYMPRGIKAFFDWQDSLATQVVANASTWNIATGKVTTLQAKQDIYVPLYNAIKNKAVRTPQQVDAHEQGSKTYRTYLRGFVKENLLYNSDITHDEKVALGLNPGGEHAPRPKINSIPGVLLTALGGQQVRLEFRVEGDESRPSIHEDADGIEVRVMMGTVPPTNISMMTNTIFSTKAKFIQGFEMDSSGQTFYLYARWRNNTDVSKSGPWCALASVVIR